jgi:hypothetical protein
VLAQFNPRVDVTWVPHERVADGPEAARGFEEGYLHGGIGGAAVHEAVHELEGGSAEDVESESVAGAKFGGGPKRKTTAKAAVHVELAVDFDGREAEGNRTGGREVAPGYGAVAYDEAAERGEFDDGKGERDAGAVAVEEFARGFEERGGVEESGAVGPELHNAAGLRVLP